MTKKITNPSATSEYPRNMLDGHSLACELRLHPWKNQKGKTFSQEGGANQADREKTNINTIIANYRANGTTPHLSANTPLYGDFTEPCDLQHQLDRVKAVQELFQSLPAEIKRECDQDPVKLLELVGDDDGRELLTELGLRIDDSLPIESHSETPGASTGADSEGSE